MDAEEHFKWFLYKLQRDFAGHGFRTAVKHETSDLARYARREEKAGAAGAIQSYN